MKDGERMKCKRGGAKQSFARVKRRVRTTGRKGESERGNAGDEAPGVLVGLGFDGGELFGIGAQ